MAYEEGGASNGLDVGIGKYTLHARGASVFLAILIVVMGSMMYLWTQSSAGEHREIISELRMMSCILSLSSDERVQLRKDMSAKVSNKQDVLLGVCPWLMRP